MNWSEVSRSPRLSTKTPPYPTARSLHGWKPQAKQLVRQEHSPTHQKKQWNDKNICYRWRSKVKNYMFSPVTQSCPTLCHPMNRSTPGLPVHHQLPGSLKLMSIESAMPSSRLILCRPLLLLPPIPPSIRLFSNKSTLHMRWPKYWSFSFRISPSKEHPGLISFRMDWLDLLAVQGTLRSLLQHHSSKASILQHSAFFTVQLSHPYMSTGKTIALTRRTFVGKVMSLLFNMLSRLVITFLPRSKHLLISWLQLPNKLRGNREPI